MSKLMKGGELDVTTAAATCHGTPGCLRGQGSCQVPGVEGSLCFMTLEPSIAELQGGHKPFERSSFFRLSLGFLLSS